MLVTELNNQFYFNDKMQLHRPNDLPAIIRENGTQEWYVDGLRHRDNNFGTEMPAIVKRNGYQAWYDKNKFISSIYAKDFDKYLQLWKELSGEKSEEINKKRYRESDNNNLNDLNKKTRIYNHTNIHDG